MKLIEAHVTTSEIFITEVVFLHICNALLVYNVSLYKILLIYSRTAILVVVPSVFDSLLIFSMFSTVIACYFVNRIAVRLFTF